MQFYYLFPTLLLWVNLVNSDLYTALYSLEELLKTEDALVNILYTYIQEQEEKLNLIKRYAKIYSSKAISSEDRQMYISNPINAYLLIKRFSVDLKGVHNVINRNHDKILIRKFTKFKKSNTLPNDEDLNGAAIGLTRLQYTYGLNTSSLASGELNGIKLGTELKAEDCFEIGRQLINSKDYYYSELWMREADIRLGMELSSTVERSEILEYLAFAAFKQGSVQSALDITNKILQLIPNDSKALHNKVYYESIINKAKQIITDEEDYEEYKKVKQNISSEPKTTIKNKKERQAYLELCRGERKLSPEILSQLKCFYKGDSRNSFLILAPFKVEEAFKQPQMLIYHDVMSDLEIETIKKMAKTRLERANILNTVGKPIKTMFRIGKSGWLHEIENDILPQISRRISDMTGLNMKTAEMLQVLNYGIGGHYEPHYDYHHSTSKNEDIIGDGDRIATVLFYLSDVAQGGATVFPYINVSIWPKKGTAAFWYNLHASTEGDARMRHAACPVLMGSKWVANKWIHERGQEFRRPCGLKLAPRKFVSFTKRPLTLNNEKVKCN